MLVIDDSTCGDVYHELIRRCCASNGPFKCSRVGEARDIGQCCLVISDQSRFLFSHHIRRVNPFFAMMEAAWVLSGSRSLAPMEFVIRRYRDFSDDGETLNGAYGHRMSYKFGVNQIEAAIRALSWDQDTRRVYLSIFSADDLLSNSKDIPCNVGVDLKIRNNGLDFVTFNRSNDAFLGVPYDVFTFRCLQRFIAKSVGVDVGRYTHVSTCMHLYKKDWERALKISEAGPSNVSAEVGYDVVDAIICNSGEISELRFDDISVEWLRRMFLALRKLRIDRDVKGALAQMPDTAIGRLASHWMTSTYVKKHN